MLLFASYLQGRTQDQAQEIRRGTYQYSASGAYVDIILDLLLIVLAIFFVATANRMAGRKYLRHNWEFAEPNSETTQTAQVKWGIAERAGELLASVETLNEPWAVVEGIGHQGAPGDAVLAAPIKADTLKPASLMVTAADRLTPPDKRKSGPNRTLG